MSEPVTIRVLGIGMGPGQITAEVAAALRSADYVVAADKGGDDPLLATRRVIAAQYGLEVVAVPDPKRDRADPAGYPGAVADWHAARVAAYFEVLAARAGTAAFLVWGDPGLYDSTIRIAGELADRLPAGFDVLPGVSAPQALAARHRIVLHEIGQPVHLTTARRLSQAIAAGQGNIVVMLGGSSQYDRLDDLADWSIWWGANLGTDTEELISGRVGDVLPRLRKARDRASAAAGWVMDAYLLRAPR